MPRYEEELPLGDDAIELVRGGGAPAVAAPAVHDHPAAPEPDAVTGDADWIAPDKGHHGTPLHASAWVDGPEETLAHPEPEAAEPGARAATSRPRPTSDQQARRPAKKGRGRASRARRWDEIMFGGGSGDVTRRCARRVHRASI